MSKKRHGWNTSIEGHIKRLDYVQFEALADMGGFNSASLNDIGENYMFVAARTGSADMVRFLLEKGVVPNKYNRRGEIPIDIAFDSQNIEMLKALIEADITISSSVYGAALEQLYIRALENGKEQVAIYLIQERGVDPEYTEDFGNNEFHFCAKYKMLELAKILPFSPRLYEHNSEHRDSLEIALLDDEGGPYVVNLIASLDPDIQKTKALIVYKARAYIKMERFQEAIKLIDSSFEVMPDDARLPFLKGLACLFTKDWDGAVESLRRSLWLEHLPKDWEEAAGILLNEGVTNYRGSKEKAVEADGVLSLLPLPQSEVAIQRPKPKRPDDAGIKSTPPSSSTAASESDEGYQSDCGSSAAQPYPSAISGRGMAWARSLLRGSASKTPSSDESPSASKAANITHSSSFSSFPPHLGAPDIDELDLVGDVMTTWPTSV